MRKLAIRISRRTVADTCSSLRAFLRFLQMTDRLPVDLASGVIAPRLIVANHLLDGLSGLNGQPQKQVGDPEIETRIAQYEMPFRMQTSVPELTDTSKKPDHVYELYGPDSRKPGTFAANCLLARRLAERNIRFIKLYHRGWDHHGGLTEKLPVLARDTDQGSAGLILDLKPRGLLDDTIVIWGGEFGRTPYCQGPLKPDSHGRDHHGRVFSMWMAGGGVKRGHVHGTSDAFGFNVAD